MANPSHPDATSWVLGLAGVWPGLLLLSLISALAAGAFWGGFELGLSRGAGPQSSPVAADPSADALALLRAEADGLRQQGALLERQRQIEQETVRSLQDQLREAQGERVALLKEASYLKRLIQEGGRGAVRVNDLRLMRGDAPDSVRFAFTVVQLIPGYGESRGRVRLVVTGTEGETERSIPLDQLPVAEPRHLTMEFEQFQGYEGTFQLPPGFVPRQIAVTLDPEGEQLAASTETFPWVLTAP